MPRRSRTSTPKKYSSSGAGRTLRNAGWVGGQVAAALTAGSAATEAEGSWYRTLDKPSWQPPSAAFPIVWTGLYATIAVASTLALNEFDRRGDEEGADRLRRALTRNLALNGLWNWLFFRWHNLGGAVVGAAALAASSVRLARLAGRARPAYRRLLVPYAAWTSFATVLAAAIWWRNSGRD